MIVHTGLRIVNYKMEGPHVGFEFLKRSYGEGSACSHVRDRETRPK
jgi:hypothetical protein